MLLFVISSSLMEFFGDERYLKQSMLALDCADHKKQHVPINAAGYLVTTGLHPQRNHA